MREIWFREQEIMEVLTEKPQSIREIANKISSKQGIYQIMPIVERLVEKGLVLKTKARNKNKNLYQKK